MPTTQCRAKISQAAVKRSSDVHRLSAANGEIDSIEIAAADRLHDHLIVTQDGDDGLDNGLGHDRIDFAGHDRRTGLPGGQPDFARRGGPDDNSRRSLAIFSRLTASVRNMPLVSTMASAFCVASTMFSARARPRR